MPAQAYLKNARVSPRKASVVAALVRGRKVEDALVILQHTPRRSAGLIRKTVASAKANAERNHGLKPDSLTVTHISVSPGMRMRRWRPIAHGSANPFYRRTSNIRVEVDGPKREAAKPKAESKPKVAKEAK